MKSNDQVKIVKSKVKDLLNQAVIELQQLDLPKYEVENDYGYRVTTKNEEGESVDSYDLSDDQAELLELSCLKNVLKDLAKDKKSAEEIERQYYNSNC